MFPQENRRMEISSIMFGFGIITNKYKVNEKKIIKQKKMTWGLATANIN